jgi:flagellar assembly protein FliH
MQKFTLKVGKEPKRLRIIRDNARIEEEIYKYNFRKYQRSLLQDRESNEEKEERLKQEKIEEQRRKEDEEREERLKELERKEAIITKYWSEFVISNKGELLELDMSRIREDSIPISVAKEEIQNAYERGSEDGQMQAMSTYRTEIEKYQEWLRRIDSVTIDLKKEHIQAIKNFENNMIDLSTMMAEAILDEKINEDKSVVIKQVRKAISSVYNEKVFKIHVNPEMVKLLEEVKSTLLIDEIEANKIEIYPNPTVPIGGCLLETSGGMLDARVKNQLRKIYKELQIENERIFDTKEVEDELNNFYEDIDSVDAIDATVPKEKEDTSSEIDLDEDFDYDDMPAEYKEMFSDDIFGEEDIDLEGNTIIPEETPEIIEEVVEEIDYQALYDDEIQKQEEEALRKAMEKENNNPPENENPNSENLNRDNTEESEENNPYNNNDAELGLNDFDFDDFK